MTIRPNKVVSLDTDKLEKLQRTLTGSPKWGHMMTCQVLCSSERAVSLCSEIRLLKCTMFAVMVSKAVFSNSSDFNFRRTWNIGRHHESQRVETLYRLSLTSRFEWHRTWPRQKFYIFMTEENDQNWTRMRARLKILSVRNLVIQIRKVEFHTGSPHRQRVQIRDHFCSFCVPANMHTIPSCILVCLNALEITHHANKESN